MSPSVYFKAISTHKGEAVTGAFPDVCKIPAPPGPFVPTPYPNAGASGSPTAVKTAPTTAPMQKSTTVSRSTGDEAGTLKGVVSSKVMGKVEYMNYSYDVKIEGESAARSLGLPVTHNNAAVTPNAPAQLRARLNILHAQITAMPGTNPNRWHQLLDAYVLTVADLYRALP